jgi:hypothetical protein
VSDSVNHPSHYNTGKIEVIEFLEDQKLDFHCANAVKYISRAGRKDPAKHIEDLEKAIWYLARKVALIRGVPPRPNEMPIVRMDQLPSTLCTEPGDVILVRPDDHLKGGRMAKGKKAPMKGGYKKPAPKKGKK